MIPRIKSLPRLSAVEFETKEGFKMHAASLGKNYLCCEQGKEEFILFVDQQIMWYYKLKTKEAKKK